MSERTALCATRGRAGRLTILLMVLITAGCGFQPRGQGGTTGQLEGSYGATGIASNSTLYRALRRAVIFAGGTWSEEQDTASHLIHIQRLTRDSRVLSVDSRNRAVEYEPWSSFSAPRVPLRRQNRRPSGYCAPCSAHRMKCWLQTASAY